MKENCGTRAPLRWAGSKRKSLIELRRFVPDEIKRYIEPFAGSACMAFALGPPAMVLGDLNPRLIEFYRCLQEDPDGLHAAYARISGDPETYYRTRARYNDEADESLTSAQFLYLNRHCFNGIYRVNARGDFNVPWGGDRVGKPLSLSDLRSASRVLQGANLVCGDFENVVTELSKGDFVYLDPPYATDEARVFREYHQESFATGDWSRLLRVLGKIEERGAKFLLSYAGPAALQRELGKWSAGSLDVMRNVGGFKSSRRRHREFIATNVMQ